MSSTAVSAQRAASMAARVRDAVAHAGEGLPAPAGDPESEAANATAKRHSGTYRGDEVRIRGSVRTLGERAVHPNACQLFHDRQYGTRCASNAGRASFSYVGKPFTDSTVTDWTPVWSLTKRRLRLLPTSLLYYGAPTVPGHEYLVSDSNGHACGATLGQAVLRALLAVVERDAVALWWYNRSRLRSVDVDGIEDPVIDRLRAACAAVGREVWVLDATSDLRIPTMVAVSRRIGHSTEDIAFGFGADIDPCRAIHQAMVGLGTNLAPNGDLVCAGAACRWWRHARVINQPYVLPAPGRPALRAAEYNCAPYPDVSSAIELIGHRLSAKGMEILVLDQTRQDIGLPVAKVLVPGMRHRWARLAPGRLYDVPVELGRQPAPTRYEDLNPYPMFR